MPRPASLYSSRVMAICGNVARDARTWPPIHAAGGDLDLRRRRAEDRLLLHALREALERRWRRRGRHWRRGHWDVNNARHDGAEERPTDALELEDVEVQREEELWHTKGSFAMVVTLPYGSVREMLGGGRGLVHLLVEVESNVGVLLLDVANDFLLSGGSEGVAALADDLLVVGGEVAAGEADVHDGVRGEVALADWNGVGNTIASVENNTGGKAGGVERRNGLDTNIGGGNIESFELVLDHLFTVGLRVHWCLGEKRWVLSLINMQFVVEGVVSDLFHIVPVGSDTMFDWILEDEDTGFGAGFITNICVLVLVIGDGLVIVIYRFVLKLNSIVRCRKNGIFKTTW